MNWYNEIEPYAAQWLRNQIDEGQLPEGVIDERDIRDVRPAELVFDECHFFCGVGIWPRALRDAERNVGRRLRRPVWTGSCPCQPFSQAGRGEGFDDERHLWPAWHWLIEQSEVGVILGEQVEGPDGLMWLDLVFSDLEARGYACGATVFPAAGVGAPHIRSRTYWVADPGGEGWEGRLSWGADQGRRDLAGYAGRGGAAGGVADAQRGGRQQFAGQGSAIVFGEASRAPLLKLGGHGAGPGGMADPMHAERRALSGGDGRDGADSGRQEAHGEPRARGEAVGMADAGQGGREVERAGRLHADRPPGHDAARRGEAMRPGPVNGVWRDADWIFCRDGFWRPIEPGSFPLAHGVPARTGRLRAYGNAICLPQATAFIEEILMMERFNE